MFYQKSPECVFNEAGYRWKNTGSGNPADTSWPVRERDHTRFTFSRPYRNIYMWQWFFHQIFLEIFLKNIGEKINVKNFLSEQLVKKVFARLFTQGNVLYVGDASGKNHLVRLRLFLCTKKWIFSGTLKLKNYAFLRNFREWNVWRSWSKDNLIEKELSETKAKKLFSDRIWNVLRSQTGKSKYTGSAETAPGPWSSSLKGSSSICVRRVRSGARKRLPCGKRATRPVECHRSRASFRRRFFAIFWLFFIGLSGYPRGRTLT